MPDPENDIPWRKLAYLLIWYTFAGIIMGTVASAVTWILDWIRWR